MECFQVESIRNLQLLKKQVYPDLLFSYVLELIIFNYLY